MHPLCELSVMPSRTQEFRQPSSMYLFEQLDADIEKRWRGQHFNEDTFSAVATEALRASNVLSRVDLRQIVDWLSTGRVPSQQFRNFGQPPINVYLGHKFIIEILLWLDSTTSIHQHGFGGAFGVLQGSSLHSRYRF